MDADTFRALDRYLGLPVCWFLTQFRGLVRWVRREKPTPRPRKVLVIKLSEMGSTVLAWPALRELGSRNPSTELFFLVFKENREIVDVLGPCPSSHVVEIDTESPARFLKTALGALRRLHRERIDATIDMDFFSRFTAAFAYLICRGDRVGFHPCGMRGLSRGDLLTRRVVFSPHTHTSVAFVALVRALLDKLKVEPYYRSRIEQDEFTYPTHVPEREDLEHVREKLKASGVEADGRSMILLVNPNSSSTFPLRRWPIERFAELCNRLLRDDTCPCWVVITGAASESGDAHYIISRVRDVRCIDFSGKTTFRELLALYTLASVLVTSDSGPAHFSSLVGLPTVVIFGPETPRLYSPPGRHHKDLYAGFPCSPCVSPYNAKKSPCTDARCLKAITVEQVLREAEALRRWPQP